MAVYRNISVTFWTDSKIDDDFTPEDKYFYLYLLTNPHTNICGCYELSIKQMIKETGYKSPKVKQELQRLEKIHKVIIYDTKTKEVMIINWSKYNWSNSEKVKKAVLRVCNKIKSERFKKIITALNNNSILNNNIYNTVTDTVTVTAVGTDTDTDTDTVVSIGYAYPIDTLSETANKKEIAFGEYKHVLLTDEQYKKLVFDYGEKTVARYIKKVDEYCEQSGKRYKNYNLAIRNTFMSRDNVKPINQSEADLYEGLTKDSDGFFVDEDGNRYV